MHPVPSSMQNLRNLSGLRSQRVTMPTVSIRVMGVLVVGLRMVVGFKDEGLSDNKSKARSFTCVSLKEFIGGEIVAGNCIAGGR
ncbi:hypothetical protein Tco_0918127 [Tanacetum coccineum]